MHSRKPAIADGWRGASQEQRVRGMTFSKGPSGPGRSMNVVADECQDQKVPRLIPRVNLTRGMLGRQRSPISGFFLNSKYVGHLDRNGRKRAIARPPGCLPVIDFNNLYK